MTEENLINAGHTILLFIAIVSMFFWSRYEYRFRKNKKNKEEVPKSYWNYRVGTRLVKHPLEDGFWREFLIIECHYRDSKPKMYGQSVKMDGYDDLTELKSTNTLITTAFSKPVIDLDNFPEEYKL